MKAKLRNDGLGLTFHGCGHWCRRSPVAAEEDTRDALSLTGRARTFHLHPLSWPKLAPKYRLTSPETAPQEMLRLGM